MKRITIIACLFALATCGKKAESPPAAGSGSGSSVAVVPPAGSSSAGSAAGKGSAAVAEAPVDVPTEEDFETDAKSKITDKNVETHLKAIEKDLGQ